MPVFISHSKSDKITYDLLCRAIDNARVPRWNESELTPGSSLSDQLRNAIAECHVCIFLATKRSVDSKWCLAELGAFWGAGKPIVVLVDDTIKNGLPPQLQHLHWTNSPAVAVEAARDAIKAASLARAGYGDCLKIHEISSMEDDFQVMHSYYDRSRWIYCCAGDFSWIRQNDKITEIVSKLANDGSFFLESYKSADTVRANIGDDLFRRISANAHFNSKRKIKCSLIEHDNGSVFLYRTTIAERSGIKTDKIVALKDRDQLAYLLRSVLKIALVHPVQSTSLLLIVGLPASGKTTVGELLKSYGYTVISAGDYVREVYARETNHSNCTSEELVKKLEETGKRLLNNEGFDGFALEMLKRVKETNKRYVVIDGIRPREVVDFITKHVADCKILYVDAPVRVLEKRAAERKDVWRLTSPHELMVKDIMPIAHTVLVNDKGKRTLENRLKDFLIRTAGNRG